MLLGILAAITTLISFLFILWNLSGPLSLALIGLDITIPGYMAWVRLIYAVVGTFFANLVGRRLIPLNFQKQRYEANFRFSLVRVRENAEGIALYRGEEREAETLNARFADVFANGWRVLFTQAQLALYQVSLQPARHHLPLHRDGARLLCRRHHARGDDADGLGLRPGAEGAVVLHRELHLSRRAARRDGPSDGPAGGVGRQAGHRHRSDAGTRPRRSRRGGPDAWPAQRPGPPLDATFALPRGRSTLITGVSGSGKSTLFRALAGIWPFGQGQVRVPAGARVLFLPQKPYIPIGTLRDAVKYPDEEFKATDAEIVAALEAVKLGHLAGRLDEVAHWTNILSGGEQQRVAAARALVFKPDWLFLDEATASLDEAMETAIYEALKQRLPRRPWCRSAIGRRCANGTTARSNSGARKARSGGWWRRRPKKNPAPPSFFRTAGLQARSCSSGPRASDELF